MWSVQFTTEGAMELELRPAWPDPDNSRFEHRVERVALAPDRVRADVRRWLRTCGAIRLRPLLDAIWLDLWRRSDDQVLAQVEQMPDRGELQLWELRRRPIAQADGHAGRQARELAVSPSMLRGSRPADAEPSVAETVVALAEPTHWIEIELIGEDDRPIAAEPFAVRLPNGEQRSGTLDARGFARLEGLRQAGTCLVSFTRLDRDAWFPVTSTSAPRHPPPV